MESENILLRWNFMFQWSEYSYIAFDYVILIIDLIDELLEFVNLIVITLFFPFLPPWEPGVDFDNNFFYILYDII